MCGSPTVQLQAQEVLEAPITLKSYSATTRTAMDGSLQQMGDMTQKLIPNANCQLRDHWDFLFVIFWSKKRSVPGNLHEGLIRVSLFRPLSFSWVFKLQDFGGSSAYSIVVRLRLCLSRCHGVSHWHSMTQLGPAGGTCCESGCQHEERSSGLRRYSTGESLSERIQDWLKPQPFWNNIKSNVMWV